MTAVSPSEDRAAIVDLIHRYSQVTTAGDFGGWAACFAPGGAFVTDGTNPGEVVSFDARNDLERFSEVAGRMMAAAPDYRMHPTAIQVEINGEQATARCFAIATSTQADGGAVLAAAGQYDDRLVRREGRWLFQERRFHQDGIVPR